MYNSFSTKPLKKTHQLINKIIFHDSYMGIEMHSGITKKKNISTTGIYNASSATTFIITFSFDWVGGVEERPKIYGMP